jgi:CheY-like chemotaxis protein
MEQHQKEVFMSVTKRILLTDDQAMQAELMSLMLIAEGHEVTIAINGLEAKNLLDKQSFDVLITDIYMPEMDGGELIGLLHEQQNNVSIIVLSGARLSAITTDLKKLGVEHFIDKPITDEKLSLLLHLISIV